MGLGPAIPATEHTTLETVLGVLGTVPRMLAQGATSAIQVQQGKKTVAQGFKDTLAEVNPYSPTTGETPLAALGMQPGLLRTGLGLTADLLAPVGPVGALIKGAGTGLKAAGKAAAATKAGAAVAEAVTPAAKAARALVVEYPGMSKYVGASGKLTAEDYMRLNKAVVRGDRSALETEMARIFKGITDPQDQRLIAFHLDDPANFPLPANRPDMAQAVTEARDLVSRTIDEDIASGRMQKWKHDAQGNLILQNLPTGVAGPAAPVSTKITNYFPHVMRKEGDRRLLEVADINTTNRFANTRTVKTLTEAEKLGASVDPIEAITARVGASNRARTNTDFLAVMAQEFGQPATGAIPTGYRPLNLQKITVGDNVAQQLKGVAFPEEMADILERGHRVWAKPEGLTKLAMDINQKFKAAVTTWNPAHHNNNLQGNVFLMSLAGMNPAAIGRAYSLNEVNKLDALLGKSSVGRMTPAQTAQMASHYRAQTIPGAAINPATKRPYTIGDAIDGFKKYNMAGSSESAIELQRAMSAGTKGPIASGTEKIRYLSSRYLEDPAKWGLLQDQLRKGVPLEKAILSTKDALIDYSELTDAEKFARATGIAPFYSWFRKMVPMLTKSVVEKPKRLRQIQTLYAAPNRLWGSDQLVAAQTWAREEGYVNRPTIPFLEGEGPTDGSIPMMRLASPALELNRIGSPRAAATSLLGPIPKALVEYGTKSDLRTGRKILDTPTGYVTASPIGAALEQARMAGLPLPTSLGTEPTLQGMTQKEGLAFLLNRIPMPLLPYAQAIAGSPGETIGTQLETPMGRRVADAIFRALGLTPRDLTAEQQIQIVEQALDPLKRELETAQIRAVGEALRQRR